MEQDTAGEPPVDTRPQLCSLVSMSSDTCDQPSEASEPKEAGIVEEPVKDDVEESLEPKLEEETPASEITELSNLETELEGLDDVQASEILGEISPLHEKVQEDEPMFDLEPEPTPNVEPDTGSEPEEPSFEPEFIAKHGHLVEPESTDALSLPETVETTSEPDITEEPEIPQEPIVPQRLESSEVELMNAFDELEKESEALEALEALESEPQEPLPQEPEPVPETDDVDSFAKLEAAVISSTADIADETPASPKEPEVEVDAEPVLEPETVEPEPEPVLEPETVEPEPEPETVEPEPEPVLEPEPVEPEPEPVLEPEVVEPEPEPETVEPEPEPVLEPEVVEPEPEPVL